MATGSIVSELKKGFKSATGQTARDRAASAQQRDIGRSKEEIDKAVKEFDKSGKKREQQLSKDMNKQSEIFDKSVRKQFRGAKKTLQGYKDAPRSTAGIKDMEAERIDLGQVPQLEAGKVGPMSAVDVDRSKIRDVQTGGVDPAVAAQMDRSQIGNVQAGQLGTSEFRGTQQDLVAALQAQAAGQAPSIAEMQAKRAGERALAQQLAMAAGATGGQAALARRTAARQQAQIGADIAATSAQARLAESLQAQQQLGQVAGEARQMDLAKEQAQQDADLKAQMQNQGVDLDVFKANMEGENKIALANLAERQTARDAELRADLANQGIDLDVEKQNAAAGNAAALANLKAETENIDRELKAAMGNQAATLDVLKQNAAAGNQAAIQNLNAALEKAGLDDAMQKAFMQNELGLSLESIAATERRKASKLAQKTHLASMGERRDLAVMGTKTGSTQNILQAQLGLGQSQQAAQASQNAGGMGAAGTVFAEVVKAFSDINLKKDINLSGDRLDDFLNKLEAYDYDYKDSNHGEGRQTSVMAQDLEKSDIGKKAIVETEDGKMVDYSKLLPEMLAATAKTHKRISKLEEALLAKSRKKSKQ